VLADWLVLLGVGKETALSDACRLEHAISAESFEAVKNHAGKMRAEQQQE
jgi:Mn-dependent DtxR family transcriptional regulator